MFALEANSLNFSGQSNTSFVISREGGFHKKFSLKHQQTCKISFSFMEHTNLNSKKMLLVNERWKMSCSPQSNVTIGKRNRIDTKTNL